MTLRDCLLPSKKNHPPTFTLCATLPQAAWMICNGVLLAALLIQTYQCRIAQEQARITQNTLTNMVFMPRAAALALEPPATLHHNP